MQRVLQISNRYNACVDMFAQKFDVYNMQSGKQFVSFAVGFENFDLFVSTVTDAIVNSHVRSYVNRIIALENNCFNLQEKELILKEVLEETDFREISSVVVRTTCEKSVINLEGLFNFRLKEFCGELKIICNEVADKYIFKNEYLDFIRMLRFFASVNYGSVDTIHVVMRCADKADLLDSSYDIYELPSTHCNYEFACMEQMFEYDSVVSSLVEASPKSIVLHNWKKYSDSDLIETLVNIFDERVCFCSGCSHCNREENL